MPLPRHRPPDSLRRSASSCGTRRNLHLRGNTIDVMLERCKKNDILIYSSGTFINLLANGVWRATKCSAATGIGKRRRPDAGAPACTYRRPCSNGSISIPCRSDLGCATPVGRNPGARGRHWSRRCDPALVTSRSPDRRGLHRSQSPSIGLRSWERAVNSFPNFVFGFRSRSTCSETGPPEGTHRRAIGILAQGLTYRE